MYPLWRGRSEPKVGRGRDFSWGRGRGRARTRFLPRPRLGPSPGVGRGGDLLPRPRPKVGWGGASCCARGWTWLLSVLPRWAAQQSERGERHCFPVRSVSERAKWLRSLRPCRLRRACQDKVSGDPHIGGGGGGCLWFSSCWSCCSSWACLLHRRLLSDICGRHSYISIDLTILQHKKRESRTLHDTEWTKSFTDPHSWLNTAPQIRKESKSKWFPN
jgi:hypothetical protein